MKINTLLIKNFRGIQSVEARDLGDTIIIAGQNGSGKSCIFDAVRLLKSVYGGYQQNEWQHFFSEFQIQLHGGSKHLQGLFNDPKKELKIESYFQLRDNEKEYIKQNASELLEETIWQAELPEAFQYGGYHKALFANQFREKQPLVNEKVKTQLPLLLKELESQEILAQVVITPAGQVVTRPSNLLGVIFSNYRPRFIGVIDYHGAQRHYGRENVQGINLNLDQQNQQYSQHTLYNYNNKYNNVKSEMAGNFIKEILSEKAGVLPGEAVRAPLIETLKELFEAFFPDKKFLGPRPTSDGSLSFPVVTQSGTEHDLDELSSGEKEILYGYLRIRSSAPKDSIILLDEPELHLNPRLIRGLPDFYKRHLGEELQNQIWLVTHSDALIREAVGKPGFSVFHMLPCGSDGTEVTQLKQLIATEDLDIAIADLVGDLAAYRPGGKGLIFEGGGDTDFDKNFVSALFSEEVRGINLISGSNKIRVKLLHETLEQAYQKGDLPTKFYAIVDKDSDLPDSTAVSRFQWDVYHIENYLLDPAIISAVLNSLSMGKDFTSDKVRDALNAAARKVVPNVLLHQLKSYANSILISSIELNFDPKSVTIGNDLAQAVSRSMARMAALTSSSLTEAQLTSKEAELRSSIEKSFSDGSWLLTLPGRDILKQFVHLIDLKIPYETFRNLIVSRMAEQGIQPAGMKTVIDAISNDGLVPKMKTAS